MGLFISSAYAAESTAPASSFFGGGMDQILLIVIFIAVFYFLLIRPQSKRAKAHKQLLASLSVGDEVITSGGVLGKIVKVNDQHVKIAVNKDGAQLILQKAAVTSTMPKGTLDNLN